MSWIVRFRIKNALIIANLISNVIGVTVVHLLVRMSYHTIPAQLYQALERTTLWFIPASFLFPLALSLIYERPIRRHFEEIVAGKTCDPLTAMAARRRLLNEPFLLILIDFAMWEVRHGRGSRRDPFRKGPLGRRAEGSDRAFRRPEKFHAPLGAAASQGSGQDPEPVFQRDGGGDPGAPRPRASVHRRCDRGRLRCAGAPEGPCGDGGER